jgi:hypothetical protein
MPVGAAAWLDHLAFVTSGRSSGQTPIFSNFKGINTAGEALELVRSGLIPFGIAIASLLLSSPIIAATGVAVGAAITAFEAQIASQTALPVTGTEIPSICIP